MARNKSSHYTSRRVVERRQNQPLGELGIAVFREIPPSPNHLTRSVEAAIFAARRIFAGSVCIDPYKDESIKPAISILSSTETRQYRDIGRVSLPLMKDRIQQNYPLLRDLLTVNTDGVASFESAQGVSAIAVKLTERDTQMLRDERQGITSTIDSLTNSEHNWVRDFAPQLFLIWVNMHTEQISDDELLEVQQFVPATLDLKKATIYRPSPKYPH